MKTILITLAALASLSLTAHAEKFNARFKFKEYTTNTLGRIAFETDTTATEVEECATDQLPPLDSKSLALVFDTVADELQVVNKADGATVCTVFAFSGGTTVTSADGKRQVRQTFLFIPDHGTNALGSISGKIQRTFDTLGNLEKFVWTAQFQASIPEDVEVIEGQLITGRKFVPGNP